MALGLLGSPGEHENRRDESVVANEDDPQITQIIADFEEEGDGDELRDESAEICASADRQLIFGAGDYD